MKAMRSSGAVKRGPRGGIYHQTASGGWASGPPPSSSALRKTMDSLRAIKHDNEAARAHFAKGHGKTDDEKRAFHAEAQKILSDHAVGRKSAPAKAAASPAPAKDNSMKILDASKLPQRPAPAEKPKMDIREALAAFASPKKLAQVRQAIQKERETAAKAKKMGIGLGGVAKR